MSEGYMVIFNVGHPGSLITTHYQESTRCDCYKIWKINGFTINIMDKSRKRPDTEATKDRCGERNCSKHNINSMCHGKRIGVGYLLNRGKCINNYVHNYTLYYFRINIKWN